ncbi:hypothetical protein AZC_3596 [Azorhizobium caulinodans ORS 571]|uniref:Uncharacterized protein n=2 Tax=Azorhizobium caulinodans TaxID=7 RepID=A8IFA6_AZOC5|nr:hypothetical protein AZC_3596 [Azorhizobium caulinodans ORS 571]
MQEAWLKPFMTKSNIAKAEADGVALAASLGLITTRVDATTFGRIWRVTPKGLSLLFQRWNDPG